MCQIHSRHRQEFKRRLERVQPALDRVKLMLRSACSSTLLNSQFYVSGECAAWLVGRVERFNVIDIFALGYKPSEFKFPYKATYTESNLYTINKTTVINFSTDGTDNKPPVQVIFSWFDFSVVSVFINLFETSLIFTYDCLCDYWMCTVTNNGCLQHGEVKYPILFNQSTLDKDTLRTFRRLQTKYKKFRKRAYDVLPRNYNDYVGKMAIEPSRINKFSMRLFPTIATNQYKSRDLAMSFCDYIYCLFCKRREQLAIKYVALWKHKTYAPPNGYGYKIAQARFLTYHPKFSDKHKDDAYIINYCTCTNIPPAPL